jgi:hypothetical protein
MRRMALWASARIFRVAAGADAVPSAFLPPGRGEARWGVEPRPGLQCWPRALTPIPAFPLKGEGAVLLSLPPGRGEARRGVERLPRATVLAASPHPHPSLPP